MQAANDITETGNESASGAESRPAEGLDGTRDKLDSETERSPKADFARRALIQAGWTVPVVLAVGLSRDANAPLIFIPDAPDFYSK
jgi:hypothetical protein